jgi:hypothetical protein
MQALQESDYIYIYIYSDPPWIFFKIYNKKNKTKQSHGGVACLHGLHAAHA